MMTMPINSLADVELSNAREASPEELETAASTIRTELRRFGRTEVSD